MTRDKNSREAGASENVIVHADPDTPSLSVRRIGSAFLFMAIGYGLMFESMRILTRALGPGDYGRLGLALVFSIYSFQLVQFGIDPLLTRMLARDNAESASRRLAACLSLKFGSAAGVLLLAAAALLLRPDVEDRLLLFLGVLDGIVLAFSVPAAFDARQRTPLYFLFAAVRQFLYVCGALLFSSLLQAWMSPALVLVVHLLCIAAQVALEWRWALREYGRLDWHYAGRTAWSLWREAWPLALSAGAWQVACAIGPPLLKWHGLTGELGLLYASNQLAMVLYSLTIIPGRMVQAQLARVDPASGVFRKTVWTYALLFTLAGVAAAVACDFAAPWLVPFICGSGFSGAVSIFVVDAWRVVGFFAGTVFIAALVCEDRLWARGVCEVIALIVTAAVAVFALPRYGAVAAAGAVAAGRAAFAVSAAILLLTGKRSPDA